MRKFPNEMMFDSRSRIPTNDVFILIEEVDDDIREYAWSYVLWKWTHLVSEYFESAYSDNTSPTLANSRNLTGGIQIRLNRLDRTNVIRLCLIKQSRI